MNSPQLSLQLANFAERAGRWDTLIALAVMADDVGLDRIVVADHVVFGEALDAYGRPELGGAINARQPTGPDGEWLEPLTLLALLAGRTSRIRLGTSILLAALRTPAVLAKQVATLDVLSGGRIDLGVGVGWQREEYEACGLDFGRRGDLLDRCLDVCRRLWTEPVVAFDDGELHFGRVHQMPKPLSDDGVPVWVSGRINPRTVNRLVRFGAGWLPWGEHIADPGPGIDELRRALEAAGRDPGELQVQGYLVLVRDSNGDIDLEATLEPVTAMSAAGVTDFRLHHRWGVDLARERDLLHSLISAFDELTGRPPRS